MILDAECAWYGDPAFDLAFVLNHLLLKGVWRPQWRGALPGDVRCRALVAPTVRTSHWEPWPALDARTAALLPALMLARIDGKSPVEYLTDARPTRTQSARLRASSVAARRRRDRDAGASFGA